MATDVTGRALAVGMQIVFVQFNTLREGTVKKLHKDYVAIEDTDGASVYRMCSRVSRVAN